jgi:hypothetical protein
MIKPEMISRRKVFSLLGFAATLGFVVPTAVLTVSEADAQTPGTDAQTSGTTPGTERRQERRAGRTERRQERRTGRTERRTERRTGRTERREERRGDTKTPDQK